MLNMAEKSHLKSADKMGSQLEDDVQRDLGSLEKAPLENVFQTTCKQKVQTVPSYQTNEHCEGIDERHYK